MDGLFVVKNCCTSTSLLTVAGDVKAAEVVQATADEVLAHKGAGDGGTPRPRTHALSVHVSLDGHPVHHSFHGEEGSHGVNHSVAHHHESAVGNL